MLWKPDNSLKFVQQFFCYCKFYNATYRNIKGG